MGRGAKGYLAGLTMLVALLAAGVGTAQGAVSADPAITVLYVKGDAEANQIVVECTGKVIVVNGVPAEDGHVACRDLEKLHVYGFGGDDTIVLGGFPEFEDEGPQIFSDEFDDYADERSILVSGGDGNDTVTVDASDAVVSGGDGNDLLRGGNAIVSASFGGPGDDHLVGGQALSLMFGGSGNDVMEGSLVFSSATGGPGADVYSGRGGSDFVFGGRGPDRLTGKGRSDLLAGGAGPDSLFGGGGGDLLIGGEGADRLRGGPGRDQQFQDHVSSKKVGGFLKRAFLQEITVAEGAGRLLDDYIG
jgi:Ca2+-binding RTX toxin-like protein